MPDHVLNIRKPDTHPTDQRLPWHFSWIDTDAMVGGSSAPTHKLHWQAYRDANVGLVVNLTEAPITPKRPEEVVADLGCERCGYSSETHDEDIFSHLFDSGATESNMNVLFLPIPDGSVPRFEQLDIFLRECNATVEQGKKVIVHCQAGVGRTGIFLAVYLMHKYNMEPHKAIALLRSYRPQSLQFHSGDWQTDPFKLHSDPNAYNRNMLQERFLERYWKYAVGISKKKEFKRRPSHGARTVALERKPYDSPKRRLSDVNRKQEDEESRLDDQRENHSEFDLSPMLVVLLDHQLENKFAAINQETRETYTNHMGNSTRVVHTVGQSGQTRLCYGCRGIVSIGPEPIRRVLRSLTNSTYWPKVVPYFPASPTLSSFSLDTLYSSGSEDYNFELDLLKAEERQRMQVSLAVRNRQV